MDEIVQDQGVQLEQLRSEVSSLRAELAFLRDATGGSSPGSQVIGSSDRVARSSRRQIIRRGALTLGAGVAGAALAGRPVAAANGDPVLVGSTNTGSASTKVVSSGQSADALFGEATSTTGSAWGVRGESASSSGVGVRGRVYSGVGETFGVKGSVLSSSGIGVLGENEGSAGDAVGVKGTTVGPFSTAVVGEALNPTDGGTGVLGRSRGEQGGFGVIGQSLGSQACTGVFGHTQSFDGYGVLAVNNSLGTGLFAQGGVGAEFVGARAAFRMVSSGAPPSNFAGFHEEGEIYFDDNEDLWLCVVGSDTSSVPKWRKIVGASTAGAIHAVEPFRVYDTRFGGGQLSRGQSRVVAVKDAIDITTGTVTKNNAVPDGATAVMFNLTCTQTAAAGWLAVSPGNASAAGASTVNWSASGQTVANATIVKLNANRQVKVFAGGATGAQAHFLIDVTGYMM